MSLICGILLFFCHQREYIITLFSTLCCSSQCFFSLMRFIFGLFFFQYISYHNCTTRLYYSFSIYNRKGIMEKICAYVQIVKTGNVSILLFVCILSFFHLLAMLMGKFRNKVSRERESKKNSRRKTRTEENFRNYFLVSIATTNCCTCLTFKYLHNFKK